MTSQTNPTNLSLKFVTLDVFTSTRYLGNPLAVVFIPASLKSVITQQHKQRIAREFNLSETVFLHTPLDDDDEPNQGKTRLSSRQIDIFTTDEELPFAGHPTIGSAYLVLHHLGWSHVDTLITRAGPIGIQSLLNLNGNGGGGGVRAKIPHAVHTHQRTLSDVLSSTGDHQVSQEASQKISAALSTNPETRKSELSAPVVSIVKGMTFVLVRLPSLAHLAEVSTSKILDFGLAKGLLDEGEWGTSFVSRYYYVPLAQENGAKEGVWDIRSRMVELSNEDPATGSAACTLASYLAIWESTSKGLERGGLKKSRFNITQGVEMGRKSDILVEASVEKGDDGEVKVKDIFLGGTAVVVMEGSVLV